MDQLDNRFLEGIAIGTQAESIKSIWVWMLAGVIGATLVANVLRWHWWRFNGWGYAAGIFAGLGTAMLFGLGQAAGWSGARGSSRVPTPTGLEVGARWRPPGRPTT